MMKKKYLQGTIKRHPDGFGFFIPDQKDHPDVYIPKQSMKGVMTMDKVMVEVEPEKGSDRFRGEVLRVTARSTKSVLGILSAFNEQNGVIRDDSNGWGEDLKIKWSDAKDAKPGQMVEVQITSYPDEDGFSRQSDRSD